MSSFRHPEFEAACSVKRGDAELPDAFGAFASVFEREFLTRPLAVGLEVLGARSSRANLGVRVWVERDAILQRLRPAGDEHVEYLDLMERCRKASPRMFAETTEPAALAPHVRFGGVEAAELALLPQSLRLCEFEEAAVQQVHDNVRGEERQRWGESLGLGDELWCVTTMGGAPPVVFVQTEARAHRVRMSGTLVAWRASYYSFTRAYDEFDCLSSERCNVRVDSRETFETRYGSSWRDYWY